MLRLLYPLVAMAAGEWLLSNPFIGAAIWLSLNVVVLGLSIGLHPHVDNVLNDADAYRMFDRMRLFSTIAIELGVMMMYCRLLIIGADLPMERRYLSMLIWLLLVYASGGLLSLLDRRRWHTLALSEFAVGAVVWVLGDIMMFHSSSTLGGLIWSAVWAYGIVLIHFALEAFSCDFETMSRLSGDDVETETMRLSDQRHEKEASLVSSGVLMLAMLLWGLTSRVAIFEGDLPRVLNICMMQLPLLFMVVAFYYALRQPLDRRNREKLMHYLEYHTQNEHVLASLRHVLVRGQRVSFTSRLVCWIAMIFLRHKVVGRERLRKGDYPSVFVCNHAFLYGPIVAALFLPTYFRPWIHDRMLREDLAQREISMSFPWVRKVFGRRLGQWLVRVAARLTTRLLLSFRPIPVVRGNSHDTLSTFDASLEALREGDNLLIFAEKPKRLDNGANPDLRNLYTGFAHIGKLYHDATGTDLFFYPVFSNQKQRVIRIGDPIRYDSLLPSREAKQTVAEALQHSMEALAKEGK